MSALAYFLLGVLTSLCVRLLLSWRGRRRDFDGEVHGTGQETSVLIEWDSLTPELSARIFDPADSVFVTSEASRQVTRQFLQGRTALALEWLRAVRGQVNQSMRAHLRAASTNSALKPADELKLGFEFLLFHLTSGILSLVIWASGPSRAASVVGYSLELAGQLRKITEDVLPASRHVPVEVMSSKQETRN